MIQQFLCIYLLLPISALAEEPVEKPVDQAAEQAKAHQALLKSAGLKSDNQALITFFRNRTLSVKDEELMDQAIRELGARSYRVREKATTRLTTLWGRSVLQRLQTATRASDPEVARRAKKCIAELKDGPGTELPCAAAELLAYRNAVQAIPDLLKYLPFADEEQVELTVIQALKALSHGKPHPAIKAALTSNEVAQRRAAAYLLGQMKDATARKKVEPLLKDKVPGVRFQAAYGLLQGQDSSGIPTLIDLLSTSDVNLKWKVEDLLLRIAGDKAPDASDSPNRNQQGAWKAWWQKHGKTIDLARLDSPKVQRGWTVVANMSKNKVWEYDRHGKERWAITGLSSPLEARVLSNNRVLITEHGGNRVTERTLAGKILWQHKLKDSPVSAQRLRNGRTFITTYSEILEVNRNGTVAYSYKPPGGRFYAGQRLPNGRIVVVTLKGTIIELDSATGKTLQSTPSGLNGCYSIEVLPNRNYLVASYSQGKVREVTPKGQTMWEYALKNAYHAELLPNGNYLITNHSGQTVLELTRSKRVVKQHNTGLSIWRAHRR